MFHRVWPESGRDRNCERKGEFCACLEDLQRALDPAERRDWLEWREEDLIDDVVDAEESSRERTVPMSRARELSSRGAAIFFTETDMVGQETPGVVRPTTIFALSILGSLSVSKWVLGVESDPELELGLEEEEFLGAMRSPSWRVEYD